MLQRALTRDLTARYRQNIITPVILKSKNSFFESLRDELSEIRRGLGSQVPGLGILRNMPQLSLFSSKEIPRFGMLSLPLTADLIEDLSESQKVERIYPDYLKFALEGNYDPFERSGLRAVAGNAGAGEGIFKDKKGKPFTSTFFTKKVIGADKANQQGYTGKGVKVVVIDSGARSSHPQNRGVISRTAAPEKGMSGEDANGHGTWVNSCVGGSYQVDPTYQVPVEGMAPDATMISIQALGFVIGTGSSSDVIQAMSMAIDYGADIVSMSLGSNDAPPDSENPEAVAVDKMVEQNIIPVIAAGNSGPGPQTVGSPGSCRNSLTVGARDTINNDLASVSSRGPTKGDGYVKPDLTAPGVQIDSALVGFLDVMVGQGQMKYGAISGTSMATPHVSGLLACARQMYADNGVLLTSDIVKTAMKMHGHTKNNEDGWGMITWDILNEHMPHVRGAPKYKYWWED